MGRRSKLPPAQEGRREWSAQRHAQHLILQPPRDAASTPDRASGACLANGRRGALILPLVVGEWAAVGSGCPTLFREPAPQGAGVGLASASFNPSWPWQPGSCAICPHLGQRRQRRGTTPQPVQTTLWPSSHQGWLALRPEPYKPGGQQGWPSAPQGGTASQRPSRSIRGWWQYNLRQGTSMDDGQLVFSPIASTLVRVRLTRWGTADGPLGKAAPPPAAKRQASWSRGRPPGRTFPALQACTAAARRPTARCCWSARAGTQCQGTRRAWLQGSTLAWLGHSRAGWRAAPERRARQRRRCPRPAAPLQPQPRRGHGVKGGNRAWRRWVCARAIVLAPRGALGGCERRS